MNNSGYWTVAASVLVGGALGLGSLAAEHPRGRGIQPFTPLKSAHGDNPAASRTTTVSAPHAALENSVKSAASRRTPESEDRNARKRHPDASAVARGPDDSTGPHVPLRRDLPPEFRDESVIQQRLERALARSGAPAEIRAIDCTSFPCVIFGEIAKGDTHQASFREAIQHEMGDDVELVDNYAAYRGIDTQVFAIAPVPPDATEDERTSLDGPLLERVHAYISSAHPASPEGN